MFIVNRDISRFGLALVRKRYLALDVHTQFTYKVLACHLANPKTCFQLHEMPPQHFVLWYTLSYPRSLTCTVGWTTDTYLVGSNKSKNDGLVFNTSSQRLK